MSDVVQQGPETISDGETISDEDLAAIEAEVAGFPATPCPGKLQALYLPGTVHSLTWRCKLCGREGHWHHETEHTWDRPQELIAQLIQAVRALKQELPLALEHLARLPYGEPFGSRNDPEFHFRHGWDSACAFMYSELSQKWHLYDENVTNKETRSDNRD
jgi:hypothetical protein